MVEKRCDKCGKILRSTFEVKKRLCKKCYNPHCLVCGMRIKIPIANSSGICHECYIIKRSKARKFSGYIRSKTPWATKAITKIPCGAEIRKNLVLAEIGEPLTMPLSILNTNCEFKREWRRIQKKWHGRYEKDWEKERQKEYNKKRHSKSHRIKNED